MNPLSVLLSLSVPCRRTTVSVMSLHTQCWFLRRVRCRSVTSPLARPTCSESRLSAQRENQEVTTWSMSSRPCPWVGALETGYFFSNVQTRFLCHLSVLWSNCVLLFFFFSRVSDPEQLHGGHGSCSRRRNHAAGCCSRSTATQTVRTHYCYHIPLS